MLRTDFVPIFLRVTCTVFAIEEKAFFFIVAYGGNDVCKVARYFLNIFLLLPHSFLIVLYLIRVKFKSKHNLL